MTAAISFRRFVPYCYSSSEAVGVDKIGDISSLIIY